MTTFPGVYGLGKTIEAVKRSILEAMHLYTKYSRRSLLIVHAMLAKSKQPSLHFLATIYKIWMMRHVDVPPDIADALIEQLQSSKHPAAARVKRRQPKPKHIPVVATVNHCSTRTTLVPAGAGRYRLQINTALRKAGGGLMRAT